MLGRPEDGWVSFQLGSPDTRYELSYLNDVALEWLSQAIHGLGTEDVFSVHGYCEPGRMVCTVSFWCCYVIFEDDDRAPACHGVIQLHVSMLDFCRQLHRDIAENLDAWVDWNEGELEAAGQGAGEKRKAQIQEKLDELAQLIEEKKEDFEEGCCFI